MLENESVDTQVALFPKSRLSFGIGNHLFIKECDEGAVMVLKQVAEVLPFGVTIDPAQDMFCDIGSCAAESKVRYIWIDSPDVDASVDYVKCLRDRHEGIAIVGFDYWKDFFSLDAVVSKKIPTIGNKAVYNISNDNLLMAIILVNESKKG